MSFFYETMQFIAEKIVNNFLRLQYEYSGLKSSNICLIFDLSIGKAVMFHITKSWNRNNQKHSQLHDGNLMPTLQNMLIF